MITVGSLVKFVWWSSYRAPSVVVDDKGHTSWHEVHPGDTGVVLCASEEDNVVVLFSHVDSLLRVSRSMLSVVD
jgi:hypothetical protein